MILYSVTINRNLMSLLLFYMLAFPFASHFEPVISYVSEEERVLKITYRPKSHLFVAYVIRITVMKFQK